MFRPHFTWFVLGSQCHLCTYILFLRVSMRLSLFCRCFLFRSSPTTTHVNLSGFGRISFGSHSDCSADYVRIFCFHVSVCICVSVAGVSVSQFTHDSTCNLRGYSRRIVHATHLGCSAEYVGILCCCVYLCLYCSLWIV